MMRLSIGLTPQTSVIQLDKGRERYVFRFTVADTRAILDTFERFAADESLSFSWDDCYVLRNEVRSHNAELPGVG